MSFRHLQPSGTKGGLMSAIDDKYATAGCKSWSFDLPIGGDGGRRERMPVKEPCWVA